MKIYIAVDMEGIGGISALGHVRRNEPQFTIGQRLLTKETNAAVRGAFDGGADEVIVADVHAMSWNILPEELDPRAKLLVGTPRVPRFPFLDETVDGMILLGYHAMAGTQEAVLEHTMNGLSWSRYSVNGTPYGELGIDAEIAAESGVPVIMTSGDDKLCAEATRWLPGVETAMVKQGVNRLVTLGLSPERSNEMVYEHAKRAVERLRAGETFVKPEIPSPVAVTICYKMIQDADAANVPGTKRLDGYTVEFNYNHLSDSYGGLWRDKGIEQLI